MRFYIIEDNETDLAILTGGIRSAFPHADILPGHVSSKWPDICKDVVKQTENTGRFVLLVDLAMPPDHSTVSQGVEQAFALKAARPKCRFIAVSHYAKRALIHPRFEETFDGLIDKGTLVECSIPEQAAYIGAVIKRVLGLGTFSEQGKNEPAVTIVDSLGFRLFEAAFGVNVGNIIVSEITPGWTNITLSAPSQGYSGCYVVRLSGIKDGCKQGLILKVSKSKPSLTRELKGLRDLLSELAPFGGLLCPMDSEAKPFNDRSAYYYRQASISGETLLDLCSHSAWNASVEATFKSILDIEIGHYLSSLHSGISADSPELFALTNIDEQRALSSKRFLLDIARHLESNRTWPRDLPTPDELCNRVLDIVRSWNAFIHKQVMLYHVAQHGDLHPGNIMVQESKQLVLIDFGRLDRWPIGYDLARLASSLRMRLLSCEHHLDWVQRDINDWDSESFCAIDIDMPKHDSICPSAVLCDHAFRQVVMSAEPQYRDALKLGYRLGTVFDLIKMFSYQDLAPLKKVWAMIQCWRLKKYCEHK